MPAFEAIAARHDLAIVEDACQAHLARRPPAGRSARSAPPARSASIRRRISARSATRGAVVTNDAALAERLQAPAQRRPDRPVSSRGVRREQPARRDAGGDPARAAAAGSPAGRRAGARSPRAIARALAGAPVVVPPECDPGHVYHLFPVLDGRSRRVSGASDRARHRHARALSRSRSRASRRSRTLAAPPCPVADRVCAEVCSLPLHPQLPDADVDVVAAAVLAYRGRPAGRWCPTCDDPCRVWQRCSSAYLPGALLFRLPVADRARRAALAAEERVFWHVILSVGVVARGGARARGARRATRFERLLVANADRLWRWSSSRGRGRLRLSRRRRARSVDGRCCRSRSSRSASWRFFPPSEYIIGGKDPGTYINEGHSDRAARLARDPRSGRRRRARAGARSCSFRRTSSSRTTASGSWGSSSRDPRRGDGHRPVSAPVSGVDRDRLRPRRPHRRAAGRRRLGDPRPASPCTSPARGWSADRGVRRGRAPRRPRHRGVVRALSQLRKS